MRGFDIKQIRMRSFQISGLTAKWGIGNSRKHPSIWDANLIGRWDTRTFPDGALATIPNTATMAGKAPDLTVTGATMASGTLQFDGVNDEASTTAFVFPDRFTVFWDADWLGEELRNAGIRHAQNIRLMNYITKPGLMIYIKSASGAYLIPNTSVAVSSSGQVYGRSGGESPFGGTVGTGTFPASPLTIAKDGGAFTQMGFRQLLIFNKELSQDEVNDVLRVMFPA